MLNEQDLIHRIQRVTVEQLRLWIDDGWVRPQYREAQMVFSEVDVARIHLICHLRLDLSIDDEAMPVILSLLDQLYGARHELRCLVKAIDHLPTEARDGVFAELKRMSSVED